MVDSRVLVIVDVVSKVMVEEVSPVEMTLVAGHMVVYTDVMSVTVMPEGNGDGGKLGEPTGTGGALPDDTPPPAMGLTTELLGNGTSVPEPTGYVELSNGKDPVDGA